MDLRLFMRVLLRFRALLVAGVLFAILLTVLSAAKVTFHGRPALSYRKPVLYESDSTVFVTRPGFPWGRGNIDPAAANLDPGRFANLAGLYSQFANTDAVQRLAHVPRGDAYEAVPLPAPDGSGGLIPFIKMKATSPLPQRAKALAARATAALQRYIAAQQKANGIKKPDRVILQLIARPSAPYVAVKPSITRPMFVFILVMTLIFGLIFVLENLRPRLKVVSPPATLDEERRLQRQRSRTVA